MVIQRILCPVDFSWYSRRALHHARAIASSYQAELHVLHVLGDLVAPIPTLAGPLLPGVLPDMRPSTLSALEAFVEESGSTDTVHTAVRHGAAADQILAYAAEMRADLLVVGTHGHSLFDHVLLGSTAEHLVHDATCPVLTVPRHGDEAGSIDRVRFTRVLCAVDFSPASTRALAFGLSLAESSAAACTLLHVVETLPVEEARTQAHFSVGEYAASRRHDALAQLESLVPPDVRKGGRVSTIVGSGRPARVILREADAANADLIVMGSQARGVLGQLLFGSTTHTVVREATCPVLTACPETVAAVRPSAAPVGDTIHGLP